MQSLTQLDTDELKMADNLGSVIPTGIPWLMKTTEALGPNEYRILYAFFDAILVSVQRDSTAPKKRRSRNVLYVPDDEYQKFFARVKNDTVILNHSSEEELENYLAEQPSKDLLFRQMLQGMLVQLPQAKISLLSNVLWALNKYETLPSACGATMLT